MTKRLAIVHTSFALVEPLEALRQEELPDVEFVNIVDDTLLADARAHGVDTRLVRRMVRYFQAAADARADLILNACSSVGETVDVARRVVDVPILKIDEPMAEEAVGVGERIAVLATVKSTLDPTVRLIERTAAERGRDVRVKPYLSDGALDLLLQGKAEEHDRIVSEAAEEAARENDVVLFAQGSMARLEATLADRIGKPLLTSPRRAFRAARRLLGDGRADAKAG